jgi:hypothetical protein
VPFFTDEQLFDRLSYAKAIDGLDDNNDGVPDGAAVRQIGADATSYIKGWLRPIYPGLAAIEANPPGEVTRLALDAAYAYAVQRHPEVWRGDSKELFKSLRVELLDLRKGVTALDVETAPEPAANVGGEVISPDPYLPIPDPVFTRGTGFF